MPADLEILLHSLPGVLMMSSTARDEFPIWVVKTSASDDESAQRRLEDPGSFDIQLYGLQAQLGQGIRSEEDFQAVQAALGWTPVSEVTFAAFRNRDADHHGLAWVSAESELTNRRIIEVPYAIDGGVVQIVTPVFLREWRTHRQFRMIK